MWFRAFLLFINACEIIRRLINSSEDLQRRELYVIDFIKTAERIFAWFLLKDSASLFITKFPQQTNPIKSRAEASLYKTEEFVRLNALISATTYWSDLVFFFVICSLFTAEG